MNINFIRKGGTGTSTSDATATADDIISPKTAYVNGEKITGIIPNNGELNYIPSDSEQIIPEGYTSGGVISAVDITNLSEYQTSLELSNAILGNLPYTALQYIQSDGNQYIDTGIQMRSDYIYETKFALNNTTSDDTKIFGCDYSPYVTVGTFASKLRYNITGSNTVNKSQDLNTHIVKLSDYCIVDGEQIVSGVSYNIENNCYIFNSNHDNFSPSKYGARCKIYYFKIFDENGDILRNMIPVLDNNRIACMYDIVSEEFFYNLGTGEFTGGTIYE